jgi:dephospho-CoA kinase
VSEVEVRTMKTIGLTGGIAAGKSTVAQILTDLGYPVVSADTIAHRIMEPGMPAYREIVRRFGAEILGPGKVIDRKRLGRIVFQNPDLRRVLEKIIHPEVSAAIGQAKKTAQQEGKSLFVAEVPLLFEAGMEADFDFVWVVTVDAEEQFRRLTARDRLSAQEAGWRLAAQYPMEVKIAKADVVIDNSNGYPELQEQVVNIVNRLIP